MTEKGLQRAPLLRATIAAVAAADLLSLVAFLHEARGESAIGAIALVAQTPFALAIAGLGVAAAFRFARAPGRIAAGAISLGALALLSTAHAQLFGSPWRHLYYSGLCLAGWITGLLVARYRGASRQEVWASTGALALLGTAYLNAGISKLVLGGGDWLTGLPIQAAIIGQDGLVPGGILHHYRMLVVETPALATALSMLTVAFELAGPLMLAGRRPRLLVAGGLLGMHLNILLLTTEILYWEAMVFLAVFAICADTAADLGEDATARPLGGALFAPAVVLLIVGAALAIRHQAVRFRELNRGATTTAVQQPPPAVLQQVGPFVVGAALDGEWSIAFLATSASAITVTVQGDAGRARFELTCKNAEHESPFDLGPAHIFYSKDLPFEALQGAGNALRDSLRRATADTDPCAAIETWRAAAAHGSGRLR